MDSKIWIIPQFKQIYKYRTKETEIITICELRKLDDNSLLSFGHASSPKDAFKPSVGKKLAFSSACYYLFIKQLNPDEKLIIEEYFDAGKAKNNSDGSEG